MNKRDYLIGLSERINEFKQSFSNLNDFSEIHIIELNEFELSDAIKSIKNKPIHLVGGLKIFQNKDLFKVIGQYFFPSENPYIGPKGYVNLGEQPYALWGAYNVMVELGLVNRAKAPEVNIIQKNIKPDTVYKFESICEYGEVIEFYSIVENKAFVKGAGLLNKK